jgi:hypothetical protein
MNRVLWDKGERLMAGSRMIFLKAPADSVGPRSPRSAVRHHSGVSQSTFLEQNAQAALPSKASTGLSERSLITIVEFGDI